MQFSIVIVSYNSKQYIKECLESVYAQDYCDYEVVLIDNASADNTTSIVRGLNANMIVKENDTNKGFPAAINQGINLSRGRYILTLNADAVLSHDFLSVLNREMETFEENVGMVGVKLLRKNEKDKIIDSTGLVLSKAIRFFDRGSGERDLDQYDHETDILGPCAAAALYKKEMLEDIKLNNEYFDGDFFYLLEDFDVALRARKKGWVCKYVPRAVCYHVRNGCGTSKGFRQYFSFRNRYFLIAKNMKFTPVFIFIFVIYDIPRFLFMLFTNSRTWNALKELRRHLPCMFEKRNEINIKASLN